MFGECRATLRDIRDGMRSQPGRIGLSFLAVAMGIASLAVLLAILGGLEEKSRLMQLELGLNVVGIMQQGDSPGSRGARLEHRHLDFLRSNFPGNLIAGLRRYTVPTPGTDQILTVLATDHNLQKVRQWPMHSGRFLDYKDMQSGERNAVISSRLSESWNWKVGDVIILRQTPFEIVGVVDAGTGSLEAELSDPGLVMGERVVFVPDTVSLDWAAEIKQPESFLDSIFMLVPGSSDVGSVVSSAQRLLSQPDYLVDQFSWVTPESLIRNIRRFQKMIKLTIGSIAFLCLLLGGTTMMSLMIADVRHRITEIGLRRALGATPQEIAVLFVSEACVVTCLAGLAGTAAAHVMLTMGGGAIAVPVRIDRISMVVPVLVAVTLGALFSYWPARVAARIAPSEALRNE